MRKNNSNTKKRNSSKKSSKARKRNLSRDNSNTTPQDKHPWSAWTAAMNIAWHKYQTKHLGNPPLNKSEWYKKVYKQD